ncbi:MAG: hypothetical protein AAF063_29575 [Cyanobacteria bacterium J06643_5]
MSSGISLFDRRDIRLQLSSNINSSRIFESSWKFLKQPLQEPRCKEKIGIDGNEVIAKTVMDFSEKNIS